MAIAGPNSAGTITSDSSFVGTAWTNPSNAGASDDSYATVALSGSFSERLLCTNFGFAIPSGAIVRGIQVDIERKASVGSAANDEQVRLVKASTVQTAEDKATVTSYPTSDGTATYGGSSDLWSNTWTASDINDSGFGVGLISFGSATVSVDNITITVTYTVGAMTFRRHTRFFRQGG